MEGYKCIFEMKSWPIDVLMTWKMGANPAARLYHTIYRELPPGTRAGYRATELYSSGEQNEAFSYIILRLTYIRGLILIGGGSSDWQFGNLIGYSMQVINIYAYANYCL